MINSSTRLLLLSPHLDDVALSCGGLVHRLARAGVRSTVASVFSGAAVEPAATSIIRELHERLATDDAREAQALRKREDLAALRVLGAHAEHLDFPDAPYRADARGAPLYATGAALFGPVHAADAALVGELVERIAAHLPRIQRAIVLAPLAVGAHVDHCLVQRAALRLRDLGAHVYFYEDYPYVDRDFPFTKLARPVVADLEGALRECSAPNQTSIALNERDLAAWAAAVARYASQVGRAAEQRAEIGPRLRAHVREEPGDALAARLWCA